MHHRLLKFLAGSAIVTLSATACSTKRNPGAELLAPDSTMIAGKLVYEQHCLTCHMASGKGAAPMNPPLVRTSFVLGEKSSLINIILNGMANLPVDGEQYRNIMPGFPFLTDEEIANVLTYVRNSFGNTADAITAADVALVRPPK
jgi:mono/diheme cytochrome c family protein